MSFSARRPRRAKRYPFRRAFRPIRRRRKKTLQGQASRRQGRRRELDDAAAPPTRHARIAVEELRPHYTGDACGMHGTRQRPATQGERQVRDEHLGSVHGFEPNRTTGQHNMYVRACYV